MDWGEIFQFIECEMGSYCFARPVSFTYPQWVCAYDITMNLKAVSLGDSAGWLAARCPQYSAEVYLAHGF